MHGVQLLNFPLDQWTKWALATPVQVGAAWRRRRPCCWGAEAAAGVAAARGAPPSARKARWAGPLSLFAACLPVRWRFGCVAPTPPRHPQAAPSQAAASQLNNRPPNPPTPQTPLSPL
jgi:hypothetical protein